jgi:hypothetical protein
MTKNKEKWEEEAKDRFITALKSEGKGTWQVSDSDVVVDAKTNRNFDYQLKSESGELIALEIFRLFESQAEVQRQRLWSTIANSIAAELRARGVKGYTIRAPYAFNVSRAKIPSFVTATANQLEAAIKQNPDTTDEFSVAGFEIKRIDDFPDVSIYGIGPGGAVDPTGIARNFISEMLPTKNQQLAVKAHERVLLIVNWASLVGQPNMIEACSLIDFSQYQNIDKVYFEIPYSPGQVHLVYDREIYATLLPGGEPPKQLSPLFISWLANYLYRLDAQAFRLVRKITEREKSPLWLPASSREQLVVYGEESLKSGDSEQLRWILEHLQNDPDPSVKNAEDDPAGRFNDHLQTKQGKSIGLIRSVRPRLCWLLMKMVTHPRIEDYERIVEMVEKLATEENLYVRMHATVPLIELSRRRFATLPSGTRYMSDTLAERVKALVLHMIVENMAYPVVLEWVAHVAVYIQDLDEETALKVVDRLLTIDHSEAANDVASMMIYFALFREHQYKQVAPFQPGAIRELLRDRLANGSGRFRALAARHFKAILDRNEISFGVVVPYLEVLANGTSNRVVNHHLYGIAAQQAASNPEAVTNLIEQIVHSEVKALDTGGRETWHPQDFAKALRELERAGPEYNERVKRIRSLLEPFAQSGRLYDVPDF